MKIADVLEQDNIIKKQVDDIVTSFDKTKNEKGENLDSFFIKILKNRNLWKHTK